MHTRTNAEWLTALKDNGDAQAWALSDLRTLLLHAARYALSRSRSRLGRAAPGDIEELAEDCAQDALSSLLRHLPHFRGDSRFTTWAYKFAVNAALLAARREHWGRILVDRLPDSAEAGDRLRAVVDGAPDPLQGALRHEALVAIRDGIEQQLTSRQQEALIAVVFDEVPLDELVRRWGSNRNALYKLLHDARRKLKAYLRDRGLEAEELLTMFGDTREDSAARRRSG